MARALVWSIALIAIAGVVLVIGESHGQVSAGGPRADHLDSPLSSGASQAQLQVESSSADAVVASGTAARAIVERTDPEVTRASNVVVRLATRGDLDAIIGVKRYDVSGLNASADRIWILAYESSEGFDHLGGLDAGLDPSPVKRAAQPIAFFAVDEASGEISQFGLLPNKEKMHEFASLSDIR